MCHKPMARGIFRQATCTSQDESRSSKKLQQHYSLRRIIRVRTRRCVRIEMYDIAESITESISLNPFNARDTTLFLVCAVY